MFSMPTETAPRLLFLFFLTLVLVVTFITIGIYWKTVVDTFVQQYRAFRGRAEDK